jgi:L-seryl-tRNA(Ser) seleniumtransferase
MSILKKIPKVDRLIADPVFHSLTEEYPKPAIVKAIRKVLDQIRTEIRSGSFHEASLEPLEIAEKVASELKCEASFSLRRVVNATGIVIHTNLGRSPLPPGVINQLTDIASHYSTLEYDTRTGGRGERYSHIESLICELTGAESALVVNNNAAALLLALSAIAKGREVIVSRGELVEIGGSFRIPDIMAQSGSILREVGTTNRTHLKDYRNALTQDTALLLKVSCSNFAMTGFTSEVEVTELAALGKDSGLPVLVDAGSGAFIDLGPLLGCNETTVQKYLQSGADLVVCSGDKLLGGPQIGIIAGSKSLVEPMKKHPLLRALRVDKMTLSALEGVLRIYRDKRRALLEIPTLRMLTFSEDEMAARGVKIIRQLKKSAHGGLKLTLLKGSSMVGGGALPQLQLPTRLIALQSNKLSAGEIEAAFRNAPTPVIGRISKGVFLLDVRTIADDDLPLLASAINRIS